MAYSREALTNVVRQVIKELDRGDFVSGPDGLAVRCAKHPIYWISVPLWTTMYDFSYDSMIDAVRKAFDSCSGCIEDAEVEAAFAFLNTRFPEGAEL